MHPILQLASDHAMISRNAQLIGSNNQLHGDDEHDIITKHSTSLVKVMCKTKDEEHVSIAEQTWTLFKEETEPVKLALHVQHASFLTYLSLNSRKPS